MMRHAPKIPSSISFTPLFMIELPRGYEALKTNFINAFLALADRQSRGKIEPGFTPKIYYDDNNQIIYSGYSHDTLVALLPSNSEARKSVATKKNPFDTSASMLAGMVQITPLHGEHLIKPGESQPFGMDVVHSDFNQKVCNEIINQTVKPRPKLMLPENTKATDIIPSLISKSRTESKSFRLFVGESHNEDAARRLIIQALPKLKNAKAVLCLEHFYYETHQALLDQWMKAPADAPMPYELERYANLLDYSLNASGKNKVGFTDILWAAKKNGVRIVAIDTEATHAMVSDISGFGLRVPAMNLVAKQIIDKEVGSENFIGLVGQAHCAHHNVTIGSSSESSVGLDQLCDAHSLCVMQLAASENKTVDEPIINFGLAYESYGSRAQRLEPDITLTIPVNYRALISTIAR